MKKINLYNLSTISLAFAGCTGGGQGIFQEWKWEMASNRIIINI
jgi:hypothetical protein